MVSGLGSNKYGAVNYDELLSDVLEKKLAANGSLIHMQRLKHKNLQTKEVNTNRQHQLAWNKELLKLKDQRHSVETDVARLITENLQDSSPTQFVYKEIENIKSEYNKGMVTFKDQTVTPVWNLYEDLKVWLCENVTGPINKTKTRSVQKNAREIGDVISSVKEQQQAILYKLAMEQRSLEDEINDICREVIVSLTNSDCIQKPVQGIPWEAIDLECPDEDLKSRVLKEFLVIDEKYNDKFQSLKDSNRDILRHGEYGGWSEDDHREFVSILEQYSSDNPQKSWLVFDRLMKQMPQISRKELIQHQKWWICWRFYRNHRSNLFRAWHRLRTELFQKTCIIFAEVCLTYELDETQMKNKQAQSELCDQLYEKVTSWRENKYEQMLLEMKLLEKKSEEMARNERQRMEMMKQKRDQTKQEIKQYKDQKLAEQQQEEENCRRRLAEIQEELEEQNKRNWKRIKYREKEWLKRIQELQEKKLLKESEETERLLRLEILREKVQVVAERDPVRLLNETKVGEQFTLQI
ncbi:coiled-coil domain-containing protein 148-like [Octopus sinensis]|uniref:Coiled-coil domain-containing protein 148-like n=1 Tax=Octopus sinensis TaxID=2607531 RepID=A0A6P7T5N6_9MOLL|nr:coiled-coil domain-containing protein 148-like [Octopus sinensis]